MPSFETRYEEGIRKYDEAPDRAEAEVIKLGLCLPTRPKNKVGNFYDLPDMPVDLSETSFEVLQTLIGQFTAWYGYVIGQLKLTEARRNSAEKKRSYSWKRVRKMKTGTVADKDDATGIDSRYIEADSHYEFCDSKYRILSGIAESLKRDIDTISRAATVKVDARDAGGAGVGVERRRQRKSPAADAFRKGKRR